MSSPKEPLTLPVKTVSSCLDYIAVRYFKRECGRSILILRNVGELVAHHWHEFSAFMKSTNEQPAESPEEQIKALASFRHEMLQFLNFSKLAAEQVGLTPQQYQAMLFTKGLSVNGQITIGELAEKLFTKHHATVELVDRMAAAGLVERRTEEWDRRRVFIALTAKGEKKLRTLAAQHIGELSHSSLAKRLKKLSPS